MTLDLALRTALLLTFTALLVARMRPASASGRHGLWRGAVVMALALPAIGSVGPSWVVWSRAGASRASTTAAAPTTPSERGADLVLWAAGAPPATTAAAALQHFWLAGAGGVSLYFLAGYVQLGMLRRRAGPAPAGWEGAARRLALRARVATAPKVRIAAVPGPLVAGLWRPVVLVPAEAERWTEARRDAVLIHELAHVARRDMLAQAAGQALTALHWFNPLAWHALGEMRRAREIACDDEVLRAGVGAASYARELLAIATARQDPQPSGGLAMARASELEERLAAVLDGRPRRQVPTTRQPWALLLAAATVVIAGARFAPEAVLASNDAAGAGGPVRWTIIPVDGSAPVPAAGADLPYEDDPATREREATRLAFATGPDAIQGLLQALADPNPGVREKAAVGLTWRRDSRVGPALAAAAADGDPRVREKVLVALAFSGDPQAAPLIAAAASDPDARVRDKARTLLLLAP